MNATHKRDREPRSEDEPYLAQGRDGGYVGDGVHRACVHCRKAIATYLVDLRSSCDVFQLDRLPDAPDGRAAKGRRVAGQGGDVVLHVCPECVSWYGFFPPGRPCRACRGNRSVFTHSGMCRRCEAESGGVWGVRSPVAGDVAPPDEPCDAPDVPNHSSE